LFNKVQDHISFVLEWLLEKGQVNFLACGMIYEYNQVIFLR
jgi:hypothetical protein